MIHTLFIGDEPAFVRSAENAINALGGDPEEDWTEYQFNKLVGEYYLDLAPTLDQKLQAACTIMQANMLGFRALSSQCLRESELGQ